MRVGDIVLTRSIYRDIVRWAFPHRYAGQRRGAIGMYCAPDSQGTSICPGTGRHLKRRVSAATPFDTGWHVV